MARTKGEKAPVWCLLGPTATGKTDLAVELAQRLPCEIISVDSGMVYRGMDIGTAKPGAATLRLAPHHLIDIRDPADAYSAADFRADALSLIAAIHAHGRVPLLVGGTMLYFRALLEGLSDLPPADPELRRRLAQAARVEGLGALHARLAEIDPVAARRIHPNDPQRLQRALEVYELTGRPLSELQRGPRQDLADSYAVRRVALFPQDRSALHQRIAARFMAMLRAGFVEEVQTLRARGDLNLQLPSMKSVGYRQVWQYLDGAYGHGEMVERGVAATRQLAKRQLTWLRGDKSLTTLDPDALGFHATLLKVIQMFSVPD